MLVITIEEYPSMPNRFHYSIGRNGKTQSLRKDAGCGAEAAAATAVRLSMEYVNEQYVIMAPRKVLDCIPENIRDGKWK